MPRVLLVEDVEEVRQILTLALQSEGHDVTDAQTCAQALPIIAAGVCDLVITDVLLPDGEGTSLADEADCRSIPYILMTGDVLTSVRLTEAGRRCLNKPFAIDVFLNTVHATLSGQSD